MRKLINSTYITLDGVIENPMWTMPYWNDEIAQFQTEDLFASDALLLGRETYEGFKDAWTSRAGSDAFADRINSLPNLQVTVDAERFPANPPKPQSHASLGDACDCGVQE